MKLYEPDPLNVFRVRNAGQYVWRLLPAAHFVGVLASLVSHHDPPSVTLRQVLGTLVRQVEWASLG